MSVKNVHGVAVALILLSATAAFAVNDRVILLIDQTLYNQVDTRLLRYAGEVEARFPVDLEIHTGSFESQSPEDIRAYLQSEWSTTGLDGVILAGHIPYALWEQDPAFGTNKGILSFFYEDLDGLFTDLNSDGWYDYHDWGTLDGPEIWSCWMRPPIMDSAGYLNALLDEIHDYYMGDFTVTKQAYVACHSDYDGNFWGGTIPSMPALVDIYGSANVGTDGEGSDLVDCTELSAQIFSQSYDIIHFWSHASSTLQQWDTGIPSSNLYSSVVMAAAPGTGPLIAHIYGCHSGDFIYAEGASAGNTNIAVAYAFGPGAGQAASGTSWSYGTEGMNYITEQMRDGWYLGESWKYLLDTRENSVAIHQRYADRDIHKELSGNNLFGNPFLYANWTGSPYTDQIPPRLDAASSFGAPTEVMVYFSEPIDPTSAAVAGNYVIDGGVTVAAAVQQVDESIVALTVSPLSPGATYTLTVNNIYDQATPPNIIAPDSSVEFTYWAWNRVFDGLVAMYDFEEADGTIVHDVSGVGTPLHLTINEPADVTWTTGGLRFDGARACTAGAAAKIATYCQATNELTIEAWIVPALEYQEGPGRIVTFSRSANGRNFTLGHGRDDESLGNCYDVKLRTSETDTTGSPGLETPPGSAVPTIQHVVYTREWTGSETIYISAVPVASGTKTGDFSTWDATEVDRLLLGDEYPLTRPWLGEYRLVAIYDRALSPAEVQQNYDAGADEGGTGYLVGDTNCDGLVNNGDIDPFLLALTDYAAYADAYPGCHNADIDGDGLVNNGDIDPFVVALAG